MKKRLALAAGGAAAAALWWRQKYYARPNEWANLSVRDAAMQFGLQGSEG